MNDTLLLIGIVAAYFTALAIMPKMRKNVTSVKLKPLEISNQEIVERVEWAKRNIKKLVHIKPKATTYDPAEDEHRKMNGEVESYFD